MTSSVHGRQRLRSLIIPVIAVGALGLAACGSDGDEGTTPDGTAAGAGETLPSTGPSLDGRSFEASSVDGHELVDGSTITISFVDGNLAANAGCNTMSGAYTIDGDVLSASNLIQTMMACGGGLDEQDTWLSGFLTSGPTITVDDDTLTLSKDGTTIVLTEQQDAPLESTRWVLTGTVENDGIATIPNGATAALTITGGQAAVETGCNTGSAEATVGDGTITFGPMALTRMACADDLMALETLTTQVLAGDVTYEISGDTLSIRKQADSGEIGLEYTAAT